MAPFIDESEGNRFVRYTSDDSKESVEQFVKANRLEVDWSHLLLSSTGTINGRRVEQYRLPIIESTFVLSLRQELQGDGFYRVLQSDLEAGHDIHGVGFESTSPQQHARYTFVLARLGIVTTREVPVGGLAVENLLWLRRQRLKTLADEANRLAFHLRQAGTPFEFFGDATRSLAIAMLCSVFGRARTVRASQGVVQQDTANQAVAHTMMVTLATALRTYVSKLTADLLYSFDEAIAIAEDALINLTSAA